MTRCLPPGGTLDQRLQRGLETGAITQGDADEVRTFHAWLVDRAEHPDDEPAEVYARHYGESAPTAIDQLTVRLDIATVDQCAECGEDIPEGADVFVRASGAVLHAECAIEPDEPDGP